MNLKYILIVWGAMLFCVGCSEDDVDSSYSFDVAGLKATVTNDKGSVVEMNTILLDSLQQQGFVGEVSFSEETRAENDRLAEEKIAEKLPEIDKLINETAIGWDTQRMGKVELTIIRLAVYEIRFDETVPTGVAINEAVELAKKFGQEGSSGFVNGILAKFA